MAKSSLISIPNPLDIDNPLDDIKGTLADFAKHLGGIVLNQGAAIASTIANTIADAIVDSLDKVLPAGMSPKKVMGNLIRMFPTDWVLPINPNIDMVSNPDYLSFGIGKIGVEVGKTEILPGISKVKYGLEFTRKPLVLPISMKLFAIPIPIPTGGFANYKINHEVNFKVFGKNISILIDQSFKFLEFNIFKPRIPLLGIPMKLDINGFTIWSITPTSEMAGKTIKLPLTYLAIGTISSWWSKPSFLSLGKSGRRLPMSWVPTYDDVQRMISQKT